MDVVLSGMRPTGNLHLGHYFGAIKNWVNLQKSYECYFFVADLHALTTHFEDTSLIKTYTKEMVLDWLACGLDLKKSTIFIQSKNIYHSELFLFLSMITPVGLLERCPTYKEMRTEFEKSGKILSNFGFLGYPVLMTADIIIYDAKYVPVGIDQVPHIEITREIARKFNNLYNEYIFKEPEPLVTESPKLPGTDGRKMSKSYNNAILLSEDLQSVENKILTMKTDTNRKRKSDPGNPFICPVYEYHKIFSSDDEKNIVIDGCTNAKIGCIECKKIVVKHIIEFLDPIQARRKKLENEIEDLDLFLGESQERANLKAGLKMNDVRKCLRLL